MDPDLRDIYGFSDGNDEKEGIYDLDWCMDESENHFV